MANFKPVVLFLKIITHFSIKRIQSSHIEIDLGNPNIFALQIDFAVSYCCEYQDEVQSAT